MKNIKRENGNVVIIAMIFVGIFMVVLLFVSAVFMSNVNSILHSVKTDMYTINKSAIMAVNKNKANVDKFEYDEREYKRYFSQMLKKNYDLNDNFENNDNLIRKLEIKEYVILEKERKDGYTNERCEDTTLHTVVKVKIKPVIMQHVFENIFTYTIHEDVNLNMVKIK